MADALVPVGWVWRYCSALGLALGAALAYAGPPATLLVVGDSLSAEYGIAKDSGWVALLQQRLQAKSVALQVVNASISGDTTAGGRSRLPALLQRYRPAVVVIELGGNDALRGLPQKTTQANLEAMTQAAQAQGAKVLLVGMQVPPNYGKRYATAFANTFAAVAKTHRAALVPFMLAGVADRDDALEWFQPDRIHPLAKAHGQILNNIWPALVPLLPVRVD